MKYLTFENAYGKIRVSERRGENSPQLRKIKICFAHSNAAITASTGFDGTYPSRGGRVECASCLSRFTNNQVGGFCRPK